MPEIDGHSLIRKVREMTGGAHPRWPSHYTTGRIRARARGRLQQLPKTAELEQLVAVLRAPAGRQFDSFHH